MPDGTSRHTLAKLFRQEADLVLVGLEGPLSTIEFRSSWGKTVSSAPSAGRCPTPEQIETPIHFPIHDHRVYQICSTAHLQPLLHWVTLTSWHARPGKLKGTSSKLFSSGLRKLMKAKPLLAKCLRSTGTLNAHTSDREGNLTWCLQHCKYEIQPRAVRPIDDAQQRGFCWLKH